MVSLADITAARDRIAGQIHRTPVLGSRTLAERSGAGTVTLKCESLQKTGSFKVRGALNAVLQLDAGSRERGVVTVSAGNHGQAVAWAARAAGIASTVVMPETASLTKAAAARGYGATVVLHGTSQDAFAHADALVKERGLTMVHPFDDPNVIAGAGTTGLEIADQVIDADVVIVPIGGGGLIAGIASALAQLRPEVRIIGVEPQGASSMRRSLDAGAAMKVERLDTIADGLASPYAGKLTYPIVRDLVDDVVLVSDDEIAAACSILLSRTKLLAEPAGAAATAGLLSGRIADLRGRHVVVLLSGGNVDLARLQTLLGDEPAP